MPKGRTKGILIGVLVAAVLIGGLSMAAYGTSRSVNPLSAVLWPIQILLTQTEHVTVSETPKVVMAKPDASLDAYMWENGGYLPVPEKQLGAMLVYQNTDGQVRILYSVNGYFAKWEWQD